ncbi:Pyridoxamine 5'-phosphate oxidase-related, FMN-binding protein [Trichormus variabilis ATCC 29413]|uniref:Pyridoxamine 5'-phosphate oxidase-related, FMN-binding protein n=2 Tax=Anabaena variabilis TaxID=264691 RepID=Q3M6Q4_TRIV2|nr:MULTISPECIES: pyridoxamine 5'-phosphate oxidase family protein [Nostocaceae]ABA23332.1 Pyridoxamine 5'-phosphate oxidase-related, FMN-binding protein [Trichormus variabilis ATCC 29413]MBC1214325.1 pyridoxamine 5'-phosphate oxidase family protein [Trichormus variabilis ARAD]MBC1254440.1 pyridoxamine 5'-phosphate oxidase family protein [Trichormus variabilis V5]MBC1268024.1 pyridoxamine 5'-phosphate oxidase family protein [Trichormus variabilis FSR]MBC1302900.1 pyridoxamine 5'-phosphate oxida
MTRKFGEIAFTPEVQAAQEERGSRQTYDRYIANGPANDTITPNIAKFIAQLEGFYLGTVSSNGYPYIQFRGGSPGFLKVLDEKTLGFADFSGNLQYITVGNLSSNDKAFLFLMDYRHRQRIKIWGRAEYIEGESSLLEQVRVADYPAQVERAILFHVEATSENCPQHIPVRYSEREVKAMMAPLENRIAELEQQLSEQNSSSKTGKQLPSRD